MDVVPESSSSLSSSILVEQTAHDAPLLLSVQLKLEKMKELQVPFGQELFDKALDTYAPLLDPLAYISQQHKDALVYSLHRSYRLFRKYRGWSHLEWVQEHITVRDIIIRIISQHTGQFVFYKMDEAEIESWIREVFCSIKKLAGQLFRTKPRPQEDIQIVVDASYRLIELMKRESCRQELFPEYYSYLVYLCSHTCLAPSNYLLNPTDITIDSSELIGCGATSDIHHCVIGSQQAVAKTYRIRTSISKGDTRNFLREALLLRLVPHPHILPTFGVIMSETALQIISPLMQNGDIVKYTKSHPNVSKKDLLEQVADGLDFLHQYMIVHGDIKGDNILITDNLKACISDLGASNFLNNVKLSEVLKRKNLTYYPVSDTQNSTRSSDTTCSSLSGMSVFSGAGTTRFMAPERLWPEKHGENSARATLPSDVFSFGMLMLEVYTGQVPFPDVKLQDFAAQQILSGNRPPKPHTMGQELWNLVQRCWKQWPNTRPTINNVYCELAAMPAH